MDVSAQRRAVLNPGMKHGKFLLNAKSEAAMIQRDKLSTTGAKDVCSLD